MTERRKAPEVARIGERLRVYRKSRGMTQSELARQIGIQQSDLSRMEKGEYRVSLDSLFRILAVFGLSVAEFFDEQRPAAPSAVERLSSHDMQTLHALRQLSATGRREVHEFIEFKRRKELTERRTETRDAEREEGG